MENLFLYFYCNTLWNIPYAPVILWYLVLMTSSLMEAIIVACCRTVNVALRVSDCLYQIVDIFWCNSTWALAYYWSLFESRVVEKTFQYNLREKLGKTILEFSFIKFVKDILCPCNFLVSRFNDIITSITNHSILIHNW